jgi:hypothetical protein
MTMVETVVGNVRKRMFEEPAEMTFFLALLPEELCQRTCL